MKQTYKPTGICARAIEFDLDKDNRIHDLRFVGGCPGNAQGVARLAEGMTAEEAIARLQGIRCQNGTSCPDQFATALKKVLNK